MIASTLTANVDVRLFWQHMLARHPKERGDGRATAEATRWHVLDEFDLIVSLTLGTHMVRVFIRGEADGNEEVIQKKLEPYETELTTTLGVPMKSDEYGRFFINRLDVDLSDETKWDEATDWLFERAEAYESALNEFLPRRR